LIGSGPGRWAAKPHSQAGTVLKAPQSLQPEKRN
jgi:hypothetical protein